MNKTWEWNKIRNNFVVKNGIYKMIYSSNYEKPDITKRDKLYNQFLAFSIALYQDSRELILLSLLILGFQVFDDVI